VGHVDHGKTTLTHAITNVWADKHSEELKRGITIRIGYANTNIYKCLECGKYSTSETCPYCGSQTEFLREISFVDCPGHESLLAVTLSGASLMDGAILVIAANEKCPQPQTKEHLMALEIAGIKNIVIVQNKVDLVDKERALENYQEIKELVKGTIAENVPIIPVSANLKINIEYVLSAIQEFIPTPNRDETKEPIMLTVRSFDVNKPGTEIKDLKGGVIGGSLTQGVFNISDEIEIKPGIEGSERTITKIVNISTMENQLEQARPGGLIAIETELDPSYTKNDKMAGRVIGKKDTLPPIKNQIKIKLHKFERSDGLSGSDINKGDRVVVVCGTAKTVGQIIEKKGDVITINLMQPICVLESITIALLKMIKNRWALVGYGKEI
jgi:translation initiation factor 2 subunit 3